MEEAPIRRPAYCSVRSFQEFLKRVQSVTVPRIVDRRRAPRKRDRIEVRNTLELEEVAAQKLATDGRKATLPSRQAISQ